MTELDYPSIDAAIQRVGLETSPAELHGQLCGLMCSRPELTYTQWFETCLPEIIEADRRGDALAAETSSLLKKLFMDSEAGIQDRDLGFQPFLPADSEQLQQRLDGLSDWSSGFLLGLAMGGIKEYKGLPGDIPEFMNDMVEISRAGSFELENEEQDENAYMELLEYVRMGVMLVRMELHHLHASGNDGKVSIH